jgi:hypothetical protein
MEKTNDLVFAHGRYQCLGKNVAMIELRKVFVEVRKCDAELSIATSILWPWVCLANITGAATTPLRLRIDKSHSTMEKRPLRTMAAI